MRAAVGLPSIEEQVELALEAKKRQAAGTGGFAGLIDMYQKGAAATEKQLADESSAASAAAAAAAVPAGTPAAAATAAAPIRSSALSRAARKTRR